MEYLLIQKKGFKELFFNEVEKLQDLSNDQLINRYNKQVEIGIVGSYSQAVFLVVLRKFFLERFNASPILLKDNILISLTSKVKHQRGKLYFLNNEPLNVYSHGK